MTTLKTNTLTDLFISNLLTSLRSNQLQNHTNLLTYTDKRKVFSIEFQSGESNVASASHIWTHAELQLVASRIVSSFLDEKPPPS